MVELAPGHTHDKLSASTEILPTEHSKRLSDVMDSKGWQAYQGQGELNASQSLWARVRVVNQDYKQRDFTLIINDPGLDEVDVFMVDDMKRILTSARIGANRPFSARAIPHRAFVLPLDIPADLPVTLYVRIADPLPLALNMDIWQSQAFVEEEQQLVIYISMLTGAFVLLSGYFLITYILMRSPVRFWFAIASFAGLLAILSSEGVIGQLTGLTRYALTTTMCLMALVIISTAKVAHALLMRVPAYWRYMSYILAWTLFVLAFVANEYWQIVLSNALTGAAIFLQLILALVFNHEHSSKPNRLYAIGWILISIGLTVKLTMYLSGIVIEPRLSLLLVGSALLGLLAIALAIEAHELSLQRSMLIRHREEVEDLDRLYRVFHRSAEGIYLATLDGKLLMINPAMCKIFGYHSEQKMLEKLDNAANLYANSSEHATLVARVTIDKVIVSHQTLGCHASGEHLQLSLCCQLLSEDDTDYLFVSLFALPEQQASTAPQVSYKAVDLQHSLQQVEQQTKLQSELEGYWVNQIHAGIQQNRLALLTLPLHNLNQATDQQHYELLLRLQNEDGELINPAVFMPHAKRYGLQMSLDKWVITTYFSWLAEHSSQLQHLHLVHINLSAQSLADEHFSVFLQQSMQQHTIPADKLCFEFAEIDVIEYTDAFLRFAEVFKSQGCKLAIDDYGRSLSTHLNVRNLPLDFVKLDGALIQNLGNDPINTAVLQSIHDLCTAFDIQTVAEIVETSELLVQLGKMGIDYAQGFCLSKPTPLEKMSF